MPLLFVEGFEFQQSLTTHSRKWGTIAGATATPFADGFVTGRLGGSSLKSTTEDWTLTTPTFSNYSGMCIGFALRANRPTDNVNLVSFRQGGTVQVNLVQRQELDSSGVPTGRFYLQVQTLGGLSIPVTSTTMLDTEQWHYIEFWVTFGTSLGVCQLYIDEVQDFSYVGPTVQSTESANSVRMILRSDAQPGNYVEVDDLYLHGASGSPTRYGDIKVEAISPSGNGVANDFTPNTGTNWEAVDEVTSDDDTTYVESTTVSDQEIYEFTDLALINGDIKAVSLDIMARLDSGVGPRTLQAVAEISSTEYLASDTLKLSSSTYDIRSKIWEASPATSSAWTTSEVNDSGFGVRITA